MGLTVLDVVERSTQEIFQAGDAKRPFWDYQSGTLSSSSLALVLGGRATYVPPDGTVEWIDDSFEIAQVESVSGSAVTLKTRGYLNTDATSHAASARVILDNPYPRKVIYDALRATVRSLRGYGLYWKNNSAAALTVSTTPQALPTNAIDVVGNTIWAYDGIEYLPLLRGKAWTIIQAFTPPKLQFSGWVPNIGQDLYFDYKKDFILPNAVYDADTASPPTYNSVLDIDLDDCGISAALQEHFPLGVAARVLMGRDVPLFEGEQAEQQPGQRYSIGNALWNRFLQDGVAAARNSQLETYPTEMGAY